MEDKKGKIDDLKLKISNQLSNNLLNFKDEQNN